MESSILYLFSMGCYHIVDVFQMCPYGHPLTRMAQQKTGVSTLRFELFVTYQDGTAEDSGVHTQVWAASHRSDHKNVAPAKDQTQDLPPSHKNNNSE